MHEMMPDAAKRSLISSLSVYPHSVSYFNELAGGPTRGHWHLIDSNIDWGQDMFFLKKWYDQNPEARPLYVDCFSAVEPKFYRIESEPDSFQIQPGWYAMSVNQLHDPRHKYDGFLKLRPLAMAGYSIYIYRLSAEDAARIRAEYSK